MLSSGGRSGQTPDINLLNPRASQCGGQHVRGGAGGHHIIDQCNVRAADAIELRLINPERISQIAAPLYGAEALLMRSVELATAKFSVDRDAEALTDTQG